jgi:anaphase-promoting complex subunit 3
MAPRLSRPFPEEAALRCRSGMMALRGNFPEKASLSFRQALAINPLLWEAFEGLCALGLLSVFFCLTSNLLIPI